MTEAEWLAFTDPIQMLYYLARSASTRKLRLVPVACCRRIWHLIASDKYPQAAAVVEALEQYLEGMVPWRELAASYLAARRLPLGSPRGELNYARWATAAAAYHVALTASCSTANHAAWAMGFSAAGRPAWWTVFSAPYKQRKREMAPEVNRRFREGRDAEYCIQADMVRDIFGNPFRRRPTIDLSWLTWTGGTVRKLAQHIYDERRFDLLPILCDALEEAGCGDEDIITHCRLETVHTRGCWVVDLLLDKA